ncbi:hypothetical protein [Carboxydocella sp. JDF658]|uniref:ATP-dependent DNA ligase n=1 Tax=Carboxydocella sp. JDF658 TaxID=1926600 RepID=UPI0009ACF112|nr:hypothetical protein [Carboxydocella sp. JDF658]GAW30973.1 bifunctional non-homologous end joining protein LigD [Carboxydocella sp. JDF658]
MPLFYPPMLGTLWREEWPINWYYEVKWDGIRALLYLEEGGWRLLSRRGQLLNHAFPALEDLRSAFSFLPVVLDGELVAFDQQGRLSFSAILKQMQGKQTLPWYYWVFDCLHLGEPLLHLPLRERKEKLARSFPHHPLAGPVQWYQGEQARLLWQKVKELELEGMMAKDPESPYLPGKRSQHWLKIKREQRLELSILGFTRENRPVSSLLVGEISPAGEKKVRGKVNCSLPAPRYQALVQLLRALTLEQEGNIFWVQPLLIAEVAYLELTAENQLRHPRLLGIRKQEEKK